MAYSASNIITWAKISQALAFYDGGQKKARGGYLDPQLHQKIKVERASLEWEYAQDPSSDNLYQMGNYVFALCFPYVFEAMVVSGGSGTSATPAVPGSSYIYNEILGTVGTTSGLTAGATTYTNTDMVNGTDLNFILLDGMVLTVGTDFSFNNSTGTITLLNGNVWVTGSKLIIPYNQLV